MSGFLIHLEHQAQPDSDLGRRMLEYFMLDWREYDLPVYPIAVLSHKRVSSGNPVPLTVQFPNNKVLEFDFDVVNLAGMEAKSYVRMANPAALALAATMRFDKHRRMRLTKDFFLTLAMTPLQGKEKKLIAGFFSAYQPLSPRESLQLEMEMGKVSSDMVRQAAIRLTNPFIELGKKRGRQEGRQQGEAQLVLRLLTLRIGPLSSSQVKAVQELQTSQIEELGEALLEFTSRADLAHWLRTNA